METVLLLDGQAVQTLIVAESLCHSGYRVVAICDGKYNYGYHSRYVNEKYIGPSSLRVGDYKKFLKLFLTEHQVDVVISMTDEAAICASQIKGEIDNSCIIAIPEYKTFQKAYDKGLLMALCKSKGYPYPKTFLFKNGMDGAASFNYPALLKPNQTTGGRGMMLVHNYRELCNVYPIVKEKYGECHLQKYVKHDGKQIKVQLFVDKEHELHYWSVIHKQRYYPVNGGSSCCNVTIEDPGVVHMCASVLKDIKWEGFADFDLIEDPDSHQYLIMEINPRIPACVKSTFKSGIDYATMIADYTLGKPLKDYHYMPGKRLRHLGFEMLWFWKSPNRWHAKPSWFMFWGKDLYYQDLSWKDIMPFFYGTLGNIKKLCNSEFRKAKSGLEGE